MTPTESNKLDELLETAQSAKRALNNRTYAFLVILAAMVAISFFQYQQGERLREIAETNRQNGQTVAENSKLIIAATGPDAQKRQRDTFTLAINEVRRSTDCVALYMNDEKYPACADVDSRMDAIRAGQDPFRP